MVLMIVTPICIMIGDSWVPTTPMFKRFNGTTWVDAD